MAALADREIVAIKKSESPLDEQEIEQLMPQVNDWELLEKEGEKRLQREFEFDDFGGALAFTNKVGRMAEEQNHHPMLLTEWGGVTVTWWTHKIGGLHENDFIAAAKTDRLYRADGRHRAD
jgi:4a-hydroxytetrahydrobiopterin dehydratase